MKKKAQITTARVLSIAVAWFILVTVVIVLSIAGSVASFERSKRVNAMYEPFNIRVAIISFILFFAILLPILSFKWHRNLQLNEEDTLSSNLAFLFSDTKFRTAIFGIIVLLAGVDHFGGGGSGLTISEFVWFTIYLIFFLLMMGIGFAFALLSFLPASVQNSDVNSFSSIVMSLVVTFSFVFYWIIFFNILSIISKKKLNKKLMTILIIGLLLLLISGFYGCILAQSPGASW